MRVQINDPAVLGKLAKLLGLEEVPTQVVVSGPKATERACSCGCGGMTRGGLWVPGHDAKRKSVLYATIRDAEATDEAKADAMAELESRGWPMPSAKAEKAEVPADATA